MFKFNIGDKFYIGATQYMVIQMDFQTDSLTAKHLNLGCSVNITGEIMSTLATKEEGSSDVFLGVQIPRIGPKVGDKFCLSDHPLLVYTVESINLYSYTYVCSVFHLGEGITKYKKVNITNTEVMEAVILPTLEEPPKEILTHEGLNCTAEMKFIEATKKAIDLANKDILESLAYSIADNEIYFWGLNRAFYPISQEGRGKTPEIFKPTCTHTRATYDSGWSKYDYCTKCDHKFKEDEK